MKILHILDHSLPLHSGYTFRSQNLFQAQKDLGFSPVVVTSPKHEQSHGPARMPKEVFQGISYYRTGTVPGSRIPMLSELRLMEALFRRILEVAQIEMPDLIHAHSPVLNALPALRAGRRLNLPVVYEIRAFWEDAAVDHGTYGAGSWKYRLTRGLETRVCSRADHVFVLCQGIRQDLVQRGIVPDKITPVFNGIRVQDFSPVPPDPGYLKDWDLDGRKVVGFIGSFYHYEGLDLLVRSFARVSSQEPDWRLLLVGGGNMREKLMAEVRSMGIQDRVIMPGRIPHDRVPGVYAMVDILAYPRYPMRLTELVTPLKPLEAMAMGKALIASDVGGHRELITHGRTGMLFRAGDLAALETGLLEMMRDADLRDALGRQGLDWVRDHHTWAKTTAVYQDIYQGLRP